MKIALAQINPTIGDFEGNIDKMMGFIEKAKGLSCDLIIFSELVISGYPPQDLLERGDFVATNRDYLNKLVDLATGIGVICGSVEENPNQEGCPFYNSAVLFDRGKTLHQVHKKVLAACDVFDERRFFEPGTDCLPLFYKGRKIGLTICEDVWDDKDLVSRTPATEETVGHMIKEGADLIIRIAASPYYVDKRELRLGVLGNIAKKYNVPLLYVNQVGGNDSLLFEGISMAFDSTGRMAARACDFEQDMVVFDTETEKGQVHPITQTSTESMLKALIMGTCDYAHKCGFNKVLVGISGGLDSALTACIAVQALGKENVLGVFMPSQYTSQQSHEDAKALAGNLGIELVHIPIGSVFGRFLETLSPVLGETSHDLTEQNIQARVRATMLMALSNKFGHLVLCSGNKSELAVGYCTLYGDLSGGLAVISDVPKTRVYELARLINKEEEVIPKTILQKPPSAELKPHQVDQDDLPPYEVLDGILEAYVGKNKGVDGITGMGFDPSTVREVIGRVDRNEYKRHQAPPGLKVTSRSFGAERRYPIAWEGQESLEGKPE
jgi:NAD+ synthetase